MELNERELKTIIYAISDLRICKRNKYVSAIELSQLNAKLLGELDKLKGIDQ